MFQAQSNASFFFVDMEDHHFEFLAESDHFGRMFNPLPCHVGDVEETIDAIEVEEYAEVGDIFDNAFADIALR